MDGRAGNTTALLTTFDVKTREIGEAAVKLLLDQIIQKTSKIKKQMIKGNLIVRESSSK
jgi:DNA-binding LacI/PurR family transcriptional regulator